MADDMDDDVDDETTPIQVQPKIKSYPPPPERSPGDPIETTVRVSEPFQVAHEGIVYASGETATVPTAIAERWILNGWVTGP